VPPSSEYSLIYPRDTNTSTFPRSLNPHLPNHTTTCTRTTLLSLTLPDYNGSYLEGCAMSLPFAVDSTYLVTLFPSKNNIPWASLQHYVKGRTVCRHTVINVFVTKHGSYKTINFYTAAGWIILHLRTNLQHPVLPLPSPCTLKRLYLSVILTLKHTIRNKTASLRIT